MAKHLVIMAGGIGSRFWPISTPQCPKQFLDITGCGRTLIQQAYDRFSGIIEPENVWVVTNKDFKEKVVEQLGSIPEEQILLEPCMRNTAPCIAYVSWKILKKDPEALAIVVPSDHIVLDVPAFQETIKRGLAFISGDNRILTLGMKPNRPETGYGYILQGEDVEQGIYRLDSFKEKPDLQTAIGYLQHGKYTWNSGIFLWPVDTIVQEIRKYASQIATIMDEMYGSLGTVKEHDTVELFFPKCEKISIDYAVMEKTQLAYVLPSEFQWSDLGTWGSMYVLSTKDENGNVVINDNARIIDAKNCVINISEERQIIVQGINNCIIAEKDGTMLICQMENEQMIKDWHD